VDFGSTYTKVTAVDVAGARLLGAASSHTTVQSDIGEGLASALEQLQQATGPLRIARRMACSSAAGGLRMVASGLVPRLTSEAARLAALGAGAKVVRAYSFELTDEDIAEIGEIAPDIFLLTGGIDGGNSACIEHNAAMLAGCQRRFPVVIAGNRSAAARCEALLDGWETHCCPNVMPALDKLEIGPVQAVVRELFLKNIVRAKGLSRMEDLVSGILMPTPLAMLKAMKLLADGIPGVPGLGELVAVDLGGATTDVYSIAKGAPQNDNTLVKGLPEPREKRTVEGDIGMRYSAAGVVQAAGMERILALSGLDEATVKNRLKAIGEDPSLLAETAAEQALDDALAAAAVALAVSRHAGTLEEVYTPMGQVYAQTGKDLTGVETLVLTGGAIIHNPKAGEIGQHALFRPGLPISLKPRRAKVYVDKSYILAAMGLLSDEYPDVAQQIMKKELVEYGTGK
jgi:uncharacterized protein (TIGR01319 family)